MKTFWRVAVRFWWPGMSYQIRQWVLQCGHCRLANSSSQLSSAWLHGYDSKSPFDIQFLDVWTPGCLPSKQGHIKLLCSMDELCGFVEGAPIAKEDSITIAREAFSRIFIPNGLPRLVIVDDGSPFKGALRAMCKLLSIPCEPVSPQNHRAVRVERFFRYLNKVERIVVANNQSFHTWLQGVYFSLYAWNSSPIDGTNIIRSFVAKGRTFPLPIDLALDSTRPGPAHEGAPALEHVATMSPVLERQRDILRLINDERRRRHRELRNAAANQKTFQPGDIVIVRRQIQSDATEGKVAKLMFKATGPYIVLQANLASLLLGAQTPIRRRCRPKRQTQESQRSPHADTTLDPLHPQTSRRGGNALRGVRRTDSAQPTGANPGRVRIWFIRTARSGRHPRTTTVRF